MGSSRASTPAGRRRTARRATAASSTARRAGKTHSKPKAQPKRPAKSAPAKRAAPKARKPRPKPKPKVRKAGASRPLLARAPKALAVLGLVLAVLAAGYMLWFRNSSFVAVEQVSIAGMSGPESAQVEAALTDASKEMTTLNVDQAALDAAVAGFPTVTGVSADASFPHELALRVESRPPVLLARAGEQVLPVAGDGTVLAGVDVGQESLPSIEVGELPATGALTGEGLEIARIMGGAPEPLMELIEAVTYEGTEGVSVTLRGDVPVYFGPGDSAREKWAAAAAILANPKIETLTYVDVRVPERPALGGAAPAVTESTTEATVPETGTGATVTP
jgi:cell division septal protein FtsQ